MRLFGLTIRKESDEEKSQLDLETSVGQGIIEMLHTGSSSMALERVKRELGKYFGYNLQQPLAIVYGSTVAVAFNGGKPEDYLAHLGNWLEENAEFLRYKPPQTIPEMISMVMMKYIENNSK